MDIEIWHIWVIVAVVLLIVEIFTPAFLAACLSIGCLLAAGFSYFDFGVKVQLLTFSVGTLCAFLGIRPLILAYGHRSRGEVLTNVEALVGKIAKVTESNANVNRQGRVVVEGDDWRAESVNGELLEVGDRVVIQKVDSTILIVTPIIKEN